MEAISSDDLVQKTLWGVRGILFLLFTGGMLAVLPTEVPAAEQTVGSVPSELPKGALEEIRLFEEETVVTAVRHEQPISKAPSNIYVITDEDIRRSGATDIPTLLRRVPGLEVMQVTGADFNVSARGDNQILANKMLVLVDGRSIYEDTQGEVFWKSIPITLPEIKRIEVLKGPASALYGFNAFDGIVHIITKSPVDMKGTTLQFGGGEFGTITAAGIQAGTIGDLGYRLSVGRDQNNRWDDRNALAFRSHKLNLHTEYALPSDSKAVFEGGVVDSNRFDGPIVNIVSVASRPLDAYVNGGYERPNFFVRGWWKQHTDDVVLIQHPLLSVPIQFTDRDGRSHMQLNADTYNVEAQHALEFGTQHRFTYGVNYRHNTLSWSLMDAFSKEDRLGFYLQEEWHPLSALTVVGGARYDLHTEIHATISPRLAVLYEVAPDHTVRAALSVAYRPPTLAESHLDQQTNVTVPTGLPFPFPPFTTLTTIAKGSHGLNPEEIVSYELGYQGWYLKHRLRLRAEVFFNHISNLIGPQTLAAPIPFGAPGFAQNINDSGQADIYGGETGIEAVLTRWLSGFANFSYEEIGQSFTGSATRRGAPRFKWNVGLRGDWANGLSAEALLYHVGAATYPLEIAFSTLAAIPPDPRVGSYNLLNLRGGYRFWHEKAEVAISVFNALNDRHKEHPLGDTIGSAVLGWLTLRL